jgi:hypothetical protein
VKLFALSKSIVLGRVASLSWSALNASILWVLIAGCGARTGVDIPEVEPGADNAYVCSCTCDWAIDDRVITSTLQACLPPELNENIGGRAPTHDDLVFDCNAHILPFAFAAFQASTTITRWERATGLECECAVQPAPGGAGESFWGGPACDRECPEILIPWHGDMTGVVGTAPVWHPDEIKAGTVFEQPFFGDDGIRPVCRVPRADPPVLLPEPPGATFVTPTSIGVVTTGEARIVLDGNAYTTAVQGDLWFAGRSCPNASCALGMGFSLHADNVGVADFIGLHSVTLEDITFAGAGTPEGLVIDESGVGSYPAGTVQAWGRGSAVERVVGEETSRTTAAFFLTTAAPIDASIDFAAGTFQLSGDFELPAGEDPAADPAMEVHVELSGILVNQPPTPRIEAPDTIECTSPLGAEVVLDGTASSDPENNIQFYNWLRDANAGEETGIGMEPIMHLVQSPGSTETYSLTVGDSFGNYVSTTHEVTVADSSAPIIDGVSLEATCLWSPNHKFALYALGDQIVVNAHDACDAQPTITIVDVRSSDPIDGIGDGSTRPDIMFGESGFCLRSERSGTTDEGRTYTVTVAVVDCSGNRTQQEMEIQVPHDGGCDAPTELLSEREAERACVFPAVERASCASDPPRVLPAAAQPEVEAARAARGCQIAQRGSAFPSLALVPIVAAVLWRRRRR